MEISPVEFTEFLKQLSLFSESKGYEDWWAGLLYIGVFGYKSDKLEPEFQKLGVWDPSGKEEGAFQSELRSLGKAYSNFVKDHDDPVFPKIYKTLEGLRTFASK